MKFAFAFVLGFCAVSINAVPQAGVVNTGHSAQFRSQDSLGNYAFGYNEDHATGGTFRRETGGPGHAQGSYGLRAIDGRVRVVNYVADGHGFRANVQTNEPGVEDQDPASVLINKAAAIVAPYISTSQVAAAAPLAIQQSIQAPVVQQYEAAPVVQQYEAAPVAVAAPIVQRYESAPVVQRYESAPVVQQYESAPVVQQYESAPLVQRYESAPVVQQYETGPLLNAGPYGAKSYDAPLYSATGPLLSGYTTKTYAAPAPILSAGYVDSGPLAAQGYATKSIAPAGTLFGSAHLSPIHAAKLSGYVLKKK